MKILSRTLYAITILLLSSCAEDMPQTYSGPKSQFRSHQNQSKPTPSPQTSTITTTTASRPSNAEMAHNLHQAVVYCLGKGTTIGSPAYEACVTKQLE